MRKGIGRSSSDLGTWTSSFRDKRSTDRFRGLDSSMHGRDKRSSRFGGLDGSLHGSSGGLFSSTRSAGIEDAPPVLKTSKKAAELEKIGQLTANRIRPLDKGTLYGREQETATLRVCLDKLVHGEGKTQKEGQGTQELQQQPAELQQQPTAQQKGRRALVLIKGYSGSGKTALVSTLKDPVMKEYRGLYVFGKFDLCLRDAQPYYGIAAACRQICQEILSLPESFYSEIQQQLTKKLGRDVHLLTKVIPELEEIVGPANPMEGSHLGESSAGGRMRRSVNGNLSYGNTSYGCMSSCGNPSNNGGLASMIGRLRRQSVAGRKMDTSSGRPSSPFRRQGSVEKEGGGASNPASCSKSQEAKRSKAKFHYVFRAFIRVITAHYAPLVMELDDLQWADIPSLILIQTLLTDRKNARFMIVGMYRSNEVEVEGDGGSSTHVLADWLSESAKICEEDTHLDTEEIEVGNLSVDTVKSIAMELLSIDDDPSTQALAELCHKKTQGNVFFLMSFISMLEEEDFLNYDIHNGKYTWDIESIKAGTSVASNMVDLMSKKMAKLPEDYRLLLSLAACLGSIFDLTKLLLVWKQFRLSDDTDTDTVPKKLSRCVQQGFVESLDESTMRYRWIHDKVQEGAFALVPATEQEGFKFRLGTILCTHLSMEELDSSIFQVVNLFNETPCDELGNPQRIRLANLNLEATRRAVSFSAFSTSTKYASKGIELLPPDSWTKNYALTLELYNYAVEGEDFIGNERKMRSYCDEVLNQKVCPLEDKLRVYNVLVSSMANLGKHAEAAALIRNVLHELKVKFPKSGTGRFMATLAGLVKARSTVRYRTSEEIDKLPIMEDQLQIEIIRLLDKLSTYTYLCGSDLCALAILKCIKITIRDGLCEFSPPAFGALATIRTGSLGDLGSGAKMGNYALLMLKKLQSQNPSARTKFVVYFFAYSWTVPFQNLFALLFEAYEDGMASGDTESAMYAIYLHMALSFMAGQSLKQLEADCCNYSRQMKELKRLQAQDFTALLWQPTHNLMGLSANTILVEGDVIPNEGEFLRIRSDSPPMQAICRAQQFRLYAIFGEFEKGANLFISHGYVFPESANPMFMASVFCGGLCCFAMAQSKKKGKFRKLAKKAQATMKDWVRQGNPNVKHCLALLDAENAVLAKRPNKAEQMYQSAIAIAARGGFLNDAALANERYGEFMLFNMSDREGAKYYFENAIKYYAEWGATKKVHVLRERHAQLLT